MSVDWSNRQNELGRHKHLATDIIDPDTAEPADLGGTPAIGGSITVLGPYPMVHDAAVWNGGAVPISEELPVGSLVLRVLVFVYEAWADEGDVEINCGPQTAWTRVHPDPSDAGPLSQSVRSSDSAHETRVYLIEETGVYIAASTSLEASAGELTVYVVVVTP